MSRISSNEYFMRLAETAAERSTCLRRKVGAVLVKDNHVISTGYNGAPKGIRNCCDEGVCMRQEKGIPSGTNLDIDYAVHAEQNAIIQCAVHGNSTQDATMYVTHQPCIECTRMIINAGIKCIIYKETYPNAEFAESLLMTAGVQLWQYDKLMKSLHDMEWKA